eukprot:gene4710-3374_t
MRRIIFWWILALWAATVFAEDRVVIVLGRTGDGKSSLANMLAQQWGIVDQPVFAEGASPAVHTAAPQSVSGGGFMIVDTPNKANMVEIVKYTNHIRINGLLLVVNGEDMALSSLTGLLQMYVDTFGSEMVNQLGVVITRSFLIDDEKITAFRSELEAVLSRLTGRPVKDTPVWLMETRTDRVEARLILDSAVQEVLNNLTVVAGEIKEWLGRQPALDVTNVVPAAHPHHRKEIEAIEKLQLALDNYHKKWLKALQRAEEDLLRVAEEVRAFAAAKAKDSHDKAQVIAALAGDLGLSQYERVTILKTATFALSLVVPNASKGIDNVAKRSKDGHVRPVSLFVDQVVYPYSL